MVYQQFGLVTVLISGMWYHILNLRFPTYLTVCMNDKQCDVTDQFYLLFEDFIVLCTIWKYVPDFLVLLIFIFFFKLLSHSGCTELLSIYTVTELMPLFVTVGH